MPVQLVNPRELKDIAQSVVAHPTMFKRALHSGALSGFRRAVQSYGALGSAVAGGAKKAVSLSIGQIPVPLVGSLLGNAFSAACDAIRKEHIRIHLVKADPADKVKFELKQIGEMVADWDNYRWKVAHAVEQYNKVATTSSAPCDSWVRVWAKYYHLGTRIKKLRDSVEAVRAITNEVDKWLEQVEKDCESRNATLETEYKNAVAKLKTDQVHDMCSDDKCMFKKGQYTSRMDVPTSENALFLIEGAKVVTGILASDPASDALDAATAD